jgi:hypothetical protein
MFTLSYSTLITGAVVLLLVNLLMSLGKYLVNMTINRGLTPDSTEEDRSRNSEMISISNHNLGTVRKIINCIGVFVILIMFTIDPFSQFGTQVDVGSEQTLEEVRQTTVTPKEVIVQTNDVAENRTRVKVAEKIEVDKAKNMADFKEFLSKN